MRLSHSQASTLNSCQVWDSCINEANPSRKKGACEPHYQMFRKYGMYTDLYPKGRNYPCVDCGSMPRRGLGRCEEHLAAFLKTNGASVPVSLKGVRRTACIVDTCTGPVKGTGTTAMCNRHFNVWNKYRLDPVWFDELHEEAAGVCQVCSRSVGERGLVVDHCHRTGKVRGLLCQMCNLALGKMEDNAIAIRRLADYLEGRLAPVS